MRFDSLRDARDAIRQKRRTFKKNAVDEAFEDIYVAEGTYFLSEPLVFEEQDHSIRIHSFEGASRPVHSGGQVLSGEWSMPATPGAPWVLTLAPVFTTGSFNQLWVGGKRAVRAREPEYGSFFHIDSQATPPNTGRGFVWQGNEVHKLVENESVDGAEAVIYDSWVARRRNIASVGQYESTAEECILFQTCTF